MPGLILGPLLRYVGGSGATVRVETEAPCEVEVLGSYAPTFRVGNHHYAPVHVTGPEPGTAHEYEVRLDVDRAWPEAGSPFPPSVVRTVGGGEAVHKPRIPGRLLPLRNALPGKKSRLQAAAWKRSATLAGRLLSSLAGVRREDLTWRLAHDEPSFDNPRSRP